MLKYCTYNTICGARTIEFQLQFPIDCEREESYCREGSCVYRVLEGSSNLVQTLQLWLIVAGTRDVLLAPTTHCEDVKCACQL